MGYSDTPLSKEPIMNIKKHIAATNKYIQDNAVLLLGGALIGAYIGGNIRGRVEYNQGRADAAKELLNDILNRK
jgi:hypothetical protein